MTQSSFYGDTPNYATDYPTQNDSNSNPVDGNTPAPSSFYPNGGIYQALANSDAVLAEMIALEAAAAADAASASASASSAADSAASAAASLADITVTAGTATPLMDGVAAVGTSTKWAHEDHVHPTDTSRAPLASPALTGNPTAPTQAALNNSTRLATTAYADGAVGVLAGDTATQLALKAPLASPALTGNPTAPTQTAGNNSTRLATTAYADTALALKAPLASPALTGTPTAPTASVGTSTTQIATTAFVLANASPVAVADTPPAGAVDNSLWWESDTGNLYIRYNDGNSTQWAAATAAAISPTGSVRYDTAQSLSAAQKTQAQQNLGMPSVLPGYLFGLTLSTAGSSTTFGIAAGTATDKTATDFMSLASAYTKTTSAWAVGTGNGALDTGSIAASTWYHAHLIKRPDTGVVDVLVSLSATAPTLPTNYTLFRRIGSMKTNGSSQWTKFIQIGDHFIWDVPFTDVNSFALSTVSTLFPLSVPPGISVDADIETYFTTTSTAPVMLIQSPLASTQVVNTPAGNFVSAPASSGGTATVLTITTDTTQNVRAVTQAAYGSPLFFIVTTGWRESRGKL